MKLTFTAYYFYLHNNLWWTILNSTLQMKKLKLREMTGGVSKIMIIIATVPTATYQKHQAGNNLELGKKLQTQQWRQEEREQKRSKAFQWLEQACQ